MFIAWSIACGVVNSIEKKTSLRLILWLYIQVSVCEFVLQLKIYGFSADFNLLCKHFQG